MDDNIRNQKLGTRRCERPELVIDTPASVLTTFHTSKSRRKRIMINLLSTHDADECDACSAKLLPRRLTSVSPSWPVLLFPPQ